MLIEKLKHTYPDATLGIQGLATLVKHDSDRVNDTLWELLDTGRVSVTVYWEAVNGSGQSTVTVYNSLDDAWKNEVGDTDFTWRDLQDLLYKDDYNADLERNSYGLYVTVETDSCNEMYSYFGSKFRHTEYWTESGRKDWGDYNTLKEAYEAQL